MSSRILHRLIHSLRKGEKRQWQRQRYQKDSARSAVLFRALEAMPVFEDAQLMRELRDSGFLPHLGEARHYLYHSILDTLLIGWQKKDTEARWRARYEQARILIDRKLFEAARRELEKVRKASEKLELYCLLLETNTQLKQLYIRHLEPRKIDGHVRHFQAAERQTLALLTERKELEWISLETFSLYYRTAQPQTSAERSEYHRLLQHSALHRDDRPASEGATIIYLNTLGLIHGLLGNWDAMLRYRRELTDLYEKRLARYPHEGGSYLAALNNWILGLIHAGQTEAARKALRQMATFPGQSKRKLRGPEQTAWFRMYHSNQLELLIREGDFSEALQKGKNIVARAKRELPEVYCYPLIYSVAYCHFARNEADEALTTLAPLLHDDTTRFKLETFRYARQLQLILLAGEGQYELLASALRSSRRYFRRLGGLTETEKLLLAFLQKLPAANERTEWIKLQEQLQAIPTTPHQRIIWHYLHLPVWVASQIRRTSFIDSYRRWQKTAQDEKA